jgi:capsular polysaccharide biosynthesis protein
VSLPPWLRRWWWIFKRVHRFVTLMCGYPFRLASPLLGARGVPRGATGKSAETAAREPDAVTLHPGSSAVSLDRGTTPGHPAGHWVFADATTTTVPASFTLEVRGGRLSGDYGALTTPGKLLDHETSSYFGVSNWREHPIYLRPTLGSTEHVDGTALSLTARGTAINYYHFLFDAIGRFGVLEECLADAKIDAVVVPHASGYQRQLLELAGIPGPWIQPRRGHTITADRMLVPSNPNWALQAPPATVAWLRDRLRPSAAAAGSPRRLYLTRGTTPRTRRYVQEPELWPHLEQRGFTRLDPGTLTVQEQIDVFSRAEVIVSPHGAGLTNVTFSPHGVQVLELFASTYVHIGLWSICKALDADYRYLVADGPGSPQGPNAGTLDDVSIPVQRVLSGLDEMLR